MPNRMICIMRIAGGKGAVIFDKEKRTLEDWNIEE